MVLLEYYTIIRFLKISIYKFLREDIISLTWFCLHLHRFRCKDSDSMQRYGYLELLDNIHVSLVTDIRFYLFTCYFW